LIVPLYENISGESNVSGYNIGPDFIQVMFSSGSVYTYSYDSAGQENVEEMKRLAIAGQGLGSFIQNNVKYDYE